MTELGVAGNGTAAKWFASHGWLDRGAGMVFAGFVVIELVNEAGPLFDEPFRAASLISVSLVLLAAGYASLPGTRLLNLSSTVVVVMIATANMVLATLQSLESDSAGSSRPFWASTFLLLMLGLRGRLVWAWSAMLGIVLLQSLWVLLRGGAENPDWGVTLGASGLLAVGTFVLTGIGRTVRDVDAAWEIERTALVDQAATTAVTEARREHTKRLLGIAGPLLERISQGKPLSAAERLDCLLVEGSLRDAARAPGLSGEVLTEAVREARRRGVHVTLFDDRQGHLLTPMEREAVAGWIVDQLSTCLTGSFTARLLPPGRGPLATVVISDGEKTSALDFAGTPGV